MARTLLLRLLVHVVREGCTRTRCLSETEFPLELGHPVSYNQKGVSSITCIWMKIRPNIPGKLMSCAIFGSTVD